jgi:hypothetical protein
MHSISCVRDELVTGDAPWRLVLVLERGWADSSCDADLSGPIRVEPHPRHRRLPDCVVSGPAIPDTAVARRRGARVTGRPAACSDAAPSPAVSCANRVRGLARYVRRRQPRRSRRGTNPKDRPNPTRVSSFQIAHGFAPIFGKNLLARYEKWRYKQRVVPYVFCCYGLKEQYVSKTMVHHHGPVLPGSQGTVSIKVPSTH